METLYNILPLFIYVLLGVLLVVLIILGMKLIETVNKTNSLLDDIDKKSKSLDGFFTTIDNVTDAFSLVSDTIIDKIAGLFGNVLSRKLKKFKEDDSDE